VIATVVTFAFLFIPGMRDLEREPQPVSG